MSDTPLAVHRVRGFVRRVMRGFESARSDEPPYDTEWKLRVRVTRDELDGGWVAEWIDFPGCMSQGETEEEALDNLGDAIGGVLAVRLQDQVGRDMHGHDDDDDTHEHEFDIAVNS